MSQTPSRRRWVVRAGTDGTGRDMFEVYAVTMEEARASVKHSAEKITDLHNVLSYHGGFTVHAIQRQDIGACAMAGNAWSAYVPAPDFPRELATA